MTFSCDDCHKTWPDKDLIEQDGGEYCPECAEPQDDEEEGGVEAQAAGKKDTHFHGGPQF